MGGSLSETDSSYSTDYLLRKILTTIMEKNAKPIVIAHRGASGYLPEHTLPCKAFAYALNSDYIEQDIVITKDNFAIVTHDREIDTTTNVSGMFPERIRKDGRYYAVDFTLAELKTLKVTERFDPTTGEAIYGGRFPMGKSFFTIPTFEEEIELIQGLNKSTGKNIGIYPEIKKPNWHRQEGKDISKTVLELLGQYGYKTKEDNFFLQTFDFDELKRVRSELGFQGKLIMLIAENGSKESPTDYAYLKTEEGIKEVAQYADGIGCSLTQILQDYQHPETPSLVSLAHKYSLKVHPYSFRVDQLPDDSKSNEELLNILFNQLKVEGLFTDFPDIVIKFLNQ